MQMLLSHSHQCTITNSGHAVINKRHLNQFHTVRPQTLTVAELVQSVPLAQNPTDHFHIQKTGNVRINVKIQGRSRNHSCRGKAISMTYSKRVSVVLVIQHAKRMRRIILSSVACTAPQYFSTFSHKRHDFRVKKLLNIKCYYFLQDLCLKLLSI
jgi:hypothetical protein